MKVIIYTDGSSRGNPGPGGYGAVLRYTDSAGVTHERELSCGYARTTNNRMEIMGVIAALEVLKRPCEVEVHSDSQYVVNAFNKRWVQGWQRRGWVNAKKEPVKNPDLWKRLIKAMKPHDVTYLGARPQRRRPQRALRSPGRCRSVRPAQHASGRQGLYGVGILGRGRLLRRHWAPLGTRLFPWGWARWSRGAP